MTPEQRKALRRYRKELTDVFAEAASTAATPGRARTWFVPYLAAVLKIYGRLTTKSVDGKVLSKVLAKASRTAFFKLLKTSNRDPKTRSRWAAALANAHQSNISPNQLPKWLRKGGGAAGRAAELSTASRGPKQTARQPAEIVARSPQPNSSLQANRVVAEATNNSIEQS